MLIIGRTVVGCFVGIMRVDQLEQVGAVGHGSTNEHMHPADCATSGEAWFG